MAMQVLLLNGPPGVGKTTVGRLLARQVPGTVVIHGDDLRAFAPEDKAAHLGPGSTYRAAAVLTEAYLAMGAARVVVDFCFLHGDHVGHYRNALAAETPFRIVTLWAPLHVVEQREKARAADPAFARSPLVEKVAECWHLIDRHRGDLGTFIDTTGVSAPALARMIVG